VLLTAGDDVRFGMPPLRDSLHLREAAIHEQFGSRNVAAVIGWEKHHGLGNLRDGSRLGR
jgi:hypothetical protein